MPRAEDTKMNETGLAPWGVHMKIGLQPSCYAVIMKRHRAECEGRDHSGQTRGITKGFREEESLNCLSTCSPDQPSHVP